MANLTRVSSFTTSSASVMNSWATEIERIAVGTFGSLTGTVKPLCTVSRTSTQSIANATDTLVTWQTADDPLGMWDPGAPTLVSIPIAGVLGVISQIRYAGSATGSTRINKFTLAPDPNTSVISEVNGAARALGTSIHNVRIRRFATSEVIYQYVAHDSGGALNLNTDYGGCVLSVVWLGP